MKWLLAAIVFCLTGCNQQASEPEPLIYLSRAEVMQVISLVENNKIEGLEKIHEMYLNDTTYGRQVSMEMKFLLDYYLYTKTALWVKAFQNQKLDSFKWKTFTSRAVASGSDSFADVLDQVLWNLNTYEGSKQEKLFAGRIANIVRARLKLVQQDEIQKGF